MMKLLREWGVPAGLLVLWAMAVAYTLNALVGMQSTLQSTQARIMAGRPAAIEAPVTAHAS